MSRINGAPSFKPAEGNDPQLFQVVDSRISGGEIKFGMYEVVGDKLTILLTQDAPRTPRLSPKAYIAAVNAGDVETGAALSEKTPSDQGLIEMIPDFIAFGK